MNRLWVRSAPLPGPGFENRLRRYERDEGFSILEASVAIAVFAVVLTLLGGMLAGGLKGVLLGKRRAVATQEASRMLEVARSLSFDEIGLSQADPTLVTDPAIVTQSGVKKYLVGTNYEPILFATNAASHPFNPHQTTVKRGSTALTKSVYVTGVDTDGDGSYDLKRVLTSVSWSDTGSSGPANHVKAETLVSETGTSSASLMTAETKATAGLFSARTSRGDIGNLVNANASLVPAVIANLPSTRGNTEQRGVSIMSCTAEPTWLQGSSRDYGKHSQTVTADNDAVTATPSNPANAEWNGSPADPINGSDDVDHVVLESSLSSKASCHASAKDQDGAAPADDGLPFGRGTASGPGSLTLNEDLTGAGLTSSILNLLALSGASATQEIDHKTASNVREIETTAAASLGDVYLLRTAGVLPDGLVKINASSYEARATASEGTPGAAPSVTLPGGLSLKVYDPANLIPSGTCTARSGGYCTVSVNAGQALNLDFAGSFTANLGLTKLDYKTKIQTYPASTTSQAGAVGPNGERRWSAEYTPLTITTQLTVTVTIDPLLGTKVVLTDSIVDFSLGPILAKGCLGVTCS